jgi:sodium pump decarboxylase gamma subunit
MVNNQANYLDRYGKHTPWIEIYNNSAATTNIGGCFLSNDPDNLRKYPITRGDRSTFIGPRQFIIFWADDDATRGTFHVNFLLDPTRENTVYLSDASGKLINELTVPASAASLADKSFGRKTDGGKELGVLEKPTPNINNVFADQDAKNVRFAKYDPTGLGMTVTAVSVVFLALILLFVIFKQVGKFYIRKGRKKAAEAKGEPVPKVKIKVKDIEGISGEVCAAIAAAIYEMQNDLHDIEDTVLTIEKTEVHYSPWSSKMYGMRQSPQVKSKR